MINHTLSLLLTFSKLNEAELEVDSERASYKQKLGVLQQQQELIDDEAEQEQKEEDARRARREAAELEAQVAQSLLPESEVFLLSGCMTLVLSPPTAFTGTGRDSGRCSDDNRAVERISRCIVDPLRQI